jgi:hypothetical protein
VNVAGLDRGGGRVEIDAAVYFQVDLPPALVDPAAQRPDLVELRADEALPAEAGIDAHHQDQVEIVDQVIDRFDRRRRVQRDAGLLAERLDELDGAVGMGAGFRMNRDDVGAGLGELRNEEIDRRDHQVDVEHLGGMGPQCGDDGRADGDVGHEMPVHHVDVDIVCAGGIDRAHFLPQTGEVSRQDGRCDKGRMLHGKTVLPSRMGCAQDHT